MGQRMKFITSEVRGSTLDWAVAQCKGITLYRSKEGGWMTADYGQFNPRHGAPWWNPSTNWGQGGPIIEREEIAIFLEYPKSWCATNGDVRSPGDTPLMAAMRCYVKSKYGEEIDTKRKMTA